uniref:Uncharacterized protein n=1 Tax=Oryza sativa subsp. japonica TaxID=39947 RepID=Q6Z2V0_ORYSJ|nr:hypothetical protein [Oryza sativa Japonica Group]
MTTRPTGTRAYACRSASPDRERPRPAKRASGWFPDATATFISTQTHVMVHVREGEHGQPQMRSG